MGFSLKGTGVAMVTPFNVDKSIDYPALDKLINFLIEGGVEYLVLQGTTGESVTLTKTEKEELISFVASKIQSRVPLILGVGGNNTSEVINTLSNYSLSSIDGILSVSPYYNKPTQKGIYEHYKAIAESTEKPIILYNVPGRTGSNITADTTLRLAGDFSNIVAVKEASGNMEQCMEIVKNKPEGFYVVSGDDALTLPLIACGFDGVISVVANAFPKEFSEMVRLSLQDDFSKARELHYMLGSIIDNLFVEGNPGGVKAVLEIQGIMQNELRLPLVPVSDKLYNTLKSQVDKIRELSLVG